MWPLANPAPAEPARAATRTALVLVPSPARTAGRGRRRLAIDLVVVIVLAGNAFGIRHLRSVDHTAVRLAVTEQELLQQLESRRNDVAVLQRDIAVVERELKVRTTARDHLHAQAAAAHSATANANAAVVATLRKAGAQRARLDALNQCLAILHKAMNAISVGDQSSGSSELRALDTRCNELGR